MSKQEIDEGDVHFRIDTRLLEELGERLVSSSDVALSELIKNSYDADAEECVIELKDKKHLKIKDNGHGMTLEEFQSRWMTIATKGKAIELVSRRYHRFLTGAKGVGRFAARTLGSRLQVETVAYSKKLKAHTKLIVVFDWKKLDKVNDLANMTINYRHIYPVNETPGTCLTISGLYAGLSDDVIKKVRSSILSLASPYKMLMPEKEFWMKNSLIKVKDKKRNIIEDPGFNINITNEEDEDLGPAKLILNAYVGKVNLTLINNKIDIEIDFKGHKKITRSFKYENCIETPVYIDIRYFPKRPGVFSGIGVDGRYAWTWKKKNHGVAVYDKGFRIKPFGIDDNDWLSVDIDVAHTERKWRSPISNKKIPIPEEDKSNVFRNPMVNIITNYQVIGCVSVQSQHKEEKNRPEYLVSSMDREGFVRNDGYQQLVDVVRFAIEYLTYEDNKNKIEKDEQAKLEEEKKIRKELSTAIKVVENSPTLTVPDKKRIIQQYKKFQKNLDDYEEYNKRSRENMDLMGFLGVLAGFMTHEHESILWQLQEATKLIKKILGKNAASNPILEKINENIANITGYVDYTRLYVGAIDKEVESNIKLIPRINHVVSTLTKFTQDRNIDVAIDSHKNTLMPVMPIPMFEGIVLNLFTNAAKAIVSQPRLKNPKILIVAWSDNKYHYLTMNDNGVGIKDELRNKVWDTLYTTTSGGNNPLGSGMGLGLPLIKRVVENIKGVVEIVDPPEGYSTCFKLSIPRETFYGKN